VSITPASPSVAPGAPARWLRLLGGDVSLPALLCIAALAEFLLFRLLQPLLRMFPHALPGWLWSVLDVAGNYSLNLASVLSLVVTAALLLAAMAPGGLASDPVRRTGLSLMSLVFLFVCSLLILSPGVAAQHLGLVRAQWLAQTSSVCLSLLTLLSVLPRRTASRRHKVALLALLMPPLLLLETHWGLLSSRGILQRYSLFLAIYGSTAAAVSLGISAALLWPSRDLRWREDSIALSCAAVLVTGMSLLLLRDHGLAARVIYIGFDIHLPVSAIAQSLFILSFAAWSISTMALLVRKGSYRRRGIGLLLVGLAGGQARTIHQACFYLAGLLCLADAVLADGQRGRGSSGHG
jgi:hypothetical protein